MVLQSALFWELSGALNVPQPHPEGVELREPATFYENRFTHGLFFTYLSQAVRHAISIPSARQRQAASIVTQSGVQFGWAEINLLHDHMQNTSREGPTAPEVPRY